ncbi:MarR family transcriptional regulator [Agromyces sp. Root81]|uniref:MarR family winged helix-turn-helix transcriptional regulator n=1 Tax=Agromyces sp. Root81 TaxID=1736601 RepID=UPI0007000DBE|nr:MarR family transcriptional regulator [Agromyces sp. Root81]KRC61838.1 MarR family transcriptional regulator [Agromyces sp. Root81]
MAAPESADAFDRDELETWSALATLLEWLPAALDAQLKRDSGISHFDFGILFALSEAEDDTLRMSDLASFANSTLSRLSRAASRLESEGRLRRAPDPADGRITLATLTDEGREFVRAATPGHVSLVRRLVFESLTATQSQQLNTISRRITGAISSHDGWHPPS